MIGVFSLWWFVFLFVVIAALIGTYFLLRDNEGSKKKFMIIACIAGMVFWTGYKIALSVDPGFDFNFWDELPLHLCNVSLPILLVGILLDNNVLKSVCYFGCNLGAVVGLLFPVDGFYDVPLLSARGLGYWAYHFFVLFICTAVVTLGIYRPKFRDIPKAFATLFIIAAFMFLINLLLRATVFEDANYFFTYGLQGNALGELMYKILPVPLICELPMIVVVAPIDCLLVLVTAPWKRSDTKNDSEVNTKCTVTK